MIWDTWLNPPALTDKDVAEAKYATRSDLSIPGPLIALGMFGLLFWWSKRS